MNINCLLNFINNPDKLDLKKIPSLYILEIIKSNHIPLIKLIIGHPKFNYLTSTIYGIFEEDQQGLYLFKGIRIKNNFLLENVDDDFFKGLTNVYAILQTSREKRFYLSELLHGSKRAKNIQLFNKLCDLYLLDDKIDIK